MAGVRIAGPAAKTAAKDINAPILSIKAQWADAWEIRPDLELRRASVATAGQDLSSLECQRRYGETRAPYEDVTESLPTREPIDLVGYWIRLQLMSGHGLTTEWVGKIEAESCEPHGQTDVMSGCQTWTAYGPLQILRKIEVYQSYWWRDGAVRTIGWVPAMNGRDGLNMAVGNRTKYEHDGSYLYGGTKTWTRLQYIEYLLRRFVDESDNGGPAWSVRGQTDELTGLAGTLTFQASQSVADIIRELISTRMGLDYYIFPNEDGFEIYVFALTGTDEQWGSAILPRNPVWWDVRVSDYADLDGIRIVKDHDHRVGKIVVAGQRMIVCCSLLGAHAIVPYETSLVGKWSAFAEGFYLPGRYNESDPDENDCRRKQEWFRSVFQAFGAPLDWDWHAQLACIVLDENGQMIPVSTGDYQTTMRKTLNWTPLRESTDYSTTPPTDNNLLDHEADYRPIEAWIWDENVAGDSHPGYVSLEQLGIGISNSQTDWGVFLSVSPMNHVLALNHWEGAYPSNVEPLYDYETLIVTLAMETDQRFAMVWENPDAKPSDGVKVIYVPDAELHYLAPGTVVGVTDDGSGLKHAPSDGLILRNDVEALAKAMCGAIARYGRTRGKAELRFRGLLAWSNILGGILRTIIEGPATNERRTDIQTPVTCVEWHCPEAQGERAHSDPMTIVRTGFAE